MRTGWKRTAVAVALTGVLAGCGGGGAGQDFPPEVVEQFMSSCTSGGTSQEVCQCALDKLEEEYSIEEFQSEAIKLAQDEASPEFAQDIQAFSTECAEEVG